MPELTIGSFNTHWGVRWHGERGRIDVVGTCLAMDADVVVLQESWRPSSGEVDADRLAAAMGATLHEIPLLSDAHPNRPRRVQPPPGPPGTSGLAVISRLPVLERRDIDLGHALGDDVLRRFGLVLTVDVCGIPVTVAGLHASHRLWGSLPQLRRLDRALAGGPPSVIAGDCNMWGPPISMVLRGRRRAVRGRTWPSPRPHSQIDHVWIDDRLEAVEAQVLADAGSDHRPVRARLRVR
jgi:endonuclease/exonuclease/phosphatase (EEP) superfamily protein YafD